MIQFDNVSKSYKQVQALDSVSFEVEPGEVFGYIGPNGAGKTTSIKILTGLIRNYNGSVYINGDEVSHNREESLKIIGYLPQDAGFQEWRTVEHTLITFARLSGLPEEQIESAVAHALKSAGIDAHRNSRIVHLSGGTIQKLRLAQAILHDPQILIFDEPLSGLDPASRYQVKELIRDLARKDRVIFLSSHILSDVENLATRIGILHNGRMRKIGTPTKLREEYGLGNIIEIVLRDQAVFEPSIFDTMKSGAASDRIVEWVESRDDGSIRVHLNPAHDLDESIGRILRIVADNELPVRSLRHLQPSLEDVYLSLTGTA